MKLAANNIEETFASENKLRLKRLPKVKTMKFYSH